MKASDLIEQLRAIPDDVDIMVRLDLSKADDVATENHRAEGRELVEVMCVRDVPSGRITDACIFVGDGEEWGRP